MTAKEREIQKYIRDVAKEERNKGANVKVRFQKLQLNGREYRWSNKDNKLREVRLDEREPTKN